MSLFFTIYACERLALLSFTGLTNFLLCSTCKDKISFIVMGGLLTSTTLMVTRRKPCLGGQTTVRIDFYWQGHFEQCSQTNATKSSFKYTTQLEEQEKVFEMIVIRWQIYNTCYYRAFHCWNSAIFDPMQKYPK